MKHPLDQPIWNALSSRQSALALGGLKARRFPAEISPFIAAPNSSPAAVAALVELLPPEEELSFLEVAPPPAPTGVTWRSLSAVQMTAHAFRGANRELPIEALGEGDAAEMLALALLTKPGPFRRRTHTLGRFLGLRDEGGRLVAMAGERLALDGFVEVSAVCTHPDFRGRGYGAALLRAVGERILSEGDVPFLHSYADNFSALALYRKLGFELRAEVTHTVWKRAW